MGKIDRNSEVITKPVMEAEPAQEALPVADAPEPVKMEEPTPEPVAAEVAESKINFSVYCHLKGIPVQNRAGMAAHTDMQSGTMSQWDDAFKTY